MTALFNLNLDDIHPETSHQGGDCGGDMEPGVFRHLRTLWKRHPQVKVTLFTTPNWQNRRQTPLHRLLRRNTRTWTGEPYRLDKHPPWCEWLQSLPHIEIALHGLTHHAPRGHPAQEFQRLTEEETTRRLQQADRILQNAGLPHSRGFRPPGWGTNEGLLRALHQWNCAYLAGTSAIHTPTEPRATSRGEGGLQGLAAFHPQEHQGLLNIPQNWDIHQSPPERAAAIAKMGGLISAKGHIAPEYEGEKTPNGLTEENLQRILEALEALEKHDVRYVTLAEAAEMWRTGGWRMG